MLWDGICKDDLKFLDLSFVWEFNILFFEFVGGVEVSDFLIGKLEVCMLILRREEWELVKCSLVKEEGGLVFLFFGNWYNVVVWGFGVLVEVV